LTQSGHYDAEAPIRFGANSGVGTPGFLPSAFSLLIESNPAESELVLSAVLPRKVANLIQINDVSEERATLSDCAMGASIHPHSGWVRHGEGAVMTLIVNTESTIDTHQFDAVNQAIVYGAPNLKVTIDDGISVISFGDYGIESTENGSALINNGNIFGDEAGVSFQGDDASIVNNIGRSIAGYHDGIRFEGDGARLTNHGAVSGHMNDGVHFYTTSNDVILNNDGTIFGVDDAVSLNSDFDGGTVNNSGLIYGDRGMFINTTSGLTTVIHNMAGGTIEGTFESIFNGIGRIFLDNRGTIIGDINLNAQVGDVNDTVVNRGKIAGDVLLGDGNDTFRGKGGGISSDVFGEVGNDKLIGGKKNDTLNGGDGLDLIRGGRGKDKLFGGADDDGFDFNSIKDSVRGSKRDKIMDFVRGDDEIDLRGIDAKKGVGGNNKFNFIGRSDFHDKKGELRYEDKGAKVIVQGDVNGDGKADFEIWVKVGALHDSDFVL
jgi:Ca2+-binding RTX toxin-like protein